MTKSCFVSIASYRDTELSDTIDSVVNNSTINLHISVVEQCQEHERINPSQWESDRVKITVQWMHPIQARGAGYARHLAMQKYTNEDYYLQIDSHTDMIQNWDEKMIAALNLACETEKSSKVILSQFPAAYKLVHRKREYVSGSKKYDPSPLCTRAFVYRRGQLAGKRVPLEGNTPQLSTIVLAGYIFAPGEFASLGYPHNIPFWGEEFMVSINAWMNGWRIYSPHEMYVWHYYGRDNEYKVWNDLSNWKDIEEESLLFMEEYFKRLKRSDKWELLHDNHRDTIIAWLNFRRGTRGSEELISKEQDIDIEYIMKKKSLEEHIANNIKLQQSASNVNE